MGRKGADHPGNFADKEKIQIREYTDEQYLRAARIEKTFTPLVKLVPGTQDCHAHRTNHGSLSDRIMNRSAIYSAGMWKAGRIRPDRPASLAITICFR